MAYTKRIENQTEIENRPVYSDPSKRKKTFASLFHCFSILFSIFLLCFVRVRLCVSKQVSWIFFIILKMSTFQYTAGINMTNR